MNRISPARIAGWRRSWSAIGLFAALCLFPAVGRAIDPVAKLKDAISQQKLDVIDKTIIPELRTIAQLRNAYFLGDWGGGREIEVDPKLEALRKKIGDRLADAIRDAADKAAKEQNADLQLTRQIAVARTIASLAESEKPGDRSPSGKFAARFVPVLTGLAKHPDVLVRQCAIDALGKVTPKPADVRPVLRAALGKKTELGPRRVAVYALIDLVKNAHYLDRNDEMDTVADAVSAAVLSLEDEDELVRAYALQAIHASAKIFTDYARSTDSAIRIDLEAKTPVLDKNVNKILQAFQDANPDVVKSLGSDASIDIRLTALETLSHIIAARIKIMDKLADSQEKVAPDKRAVRGDLFKAFQAPDPIAKLLDKDWEVVPGLLKRTNDVRLRRGAMAVLEMVAEDLDSALEKKYLDKKASEQMRRRFVELTAPGLRDPDRLVRWSTARTMRYVSPNLIDAEIVIALGEMLIDTTDADLSATAVATLEAIADGKFAPRAMRYLKSAITDREKDVEIREAALRTVVQIGGASGNETFPEITSILTDPDVRIRRLAAEALGILGHPPTLQMANDAIAALKIALRDDDAQVRQNAAEALLSIVVPR